MRSGDKPGLTRREAIFGGAASFAALSSSSPLAHDLPQGTWTRLADMPFPVQEIYPAPFWIDEWDGVKPRQRGVLVNAGGLTNAPGFQHNVSARTVVYDPATNVWREGARLPEPRHHLQLCYHNGFLYAAGGFLRNERGGWQMRQQLWRLDSPEAGAWRPLTSMPAPQAECVSASLGVRLHVIGGRAPKGSQNLHWADHIDTDMHWAYHPGEDRWEARRPPPSARNSAASASVAGLLYVFGGRTVRDGNVPTTEVYDPKADRWQALSPMPKPIRQPAPRGQGGLAAAAFRGKIYVMGGEWFGDTSGVYADVWEYDTRADTWRAVAAMPHPRHGLGAVALADGIYVCGGATGPSSEGVSPILERFSV
jgi:hypothetical protein